MGEKLTMEKHVEIDTIPVDSILLLKIDGVPRIEEVASKNGNGSWKKVSMRFKILGFQTLGDGSHPSQWEEMVGKNIFGSVPARFTDSPDNKLKQWAEAILDMPLDIGFDLDLDYFDGRQVRGVTSQYTGKNGARHQVESLLPIGNHKPVFYGEDPSAARPATGMDAQWTPGPMVAQPQQPSADPWAVGPTARPEPVQQVQPQGFDFDDPEDAGF